MMTMMVIHSQKVVIVSLANTKNQGGDAIGRLANHSSLRLAVQACPTIPPHSRHGSHIPRHTSVWRGPTAVMHLNLCFAPFRIVFLQVPLPDKNSSA